MNEPLAIANTVNKFLISVGSNLTDQIPKVAPASNFDNIFQSMYFSKCNFIETHSVINKLKPKISTGIDEISNHFLQNTAYIIASYLSY